MAFTFGRGQKISAWLRERPRLFLDWEKTEGVLSPGLCDKHKHEEGTPMLLEQATASNVSRALKEIDAFEWEGDFKPVARQALKQLMEKRLEEEMAQYLGLSRYERAVDRPDYRNGHYGVPGSGLSMDLLARPRFPIHPTTKKPPPRETQSGAAVWNQRCDGIEGPSRS